MPTAIKEDVVRFYIAFTCQSLLGTLNGFNTLGVEWLCLPMNEPQFVNGFDSQGNLCHVETSNVFRKNLVLDEHSHEVTAR